MSNYHIPVMPEEAIKYLEIKKDSWYIDCNLGGGGHTEKILNAGGKVIGIDLDPDAIAEVSNNLKEYMPDRLVLVKSNFSKLKDIHTQLGNPKIEGILFDLGVSSYQLETPERGFSFNTDAPLDMRMDKSSSVSAKDLVNALHESELATLFWKLGEERFAKKIAKKIAEARKTQPIETTNQLAKLILSGRPRGGTDRTHPATRVFQALRIAVNDELNSLKDTLPQALEILEPDGRLVVISFHSLEDRIVKDYFKESSQKGLATLLTKKPIEPSEEEVLYNPRSRSGKLRVIQKKSLAS